MLLRLHGSDNNHARRSAIRDHECIKPFTSDNLLEIGVKNQTIVRQNRVDPVARPWQ